MTKFFTHWFEGRKIDHIVCDEDKTKTICGLATKPANDIRFLPFLSFDNHHTYCRNCAKIYDNNIIKIRIHQRNEES